MGDSHAGMYERNMQGENGNRFGSFTKYVFPVEEKTEKVYYTYRRIGYEQAEAKSDIMKKAAEDRLIKRTATLHG